MTITISLAQVGYFILFCLLAVVGIYLVIVLYRFSQVLKQVQALLEKNSANLDKSLEALPQILDNVNGTTEIILHSADKAEMAIESIGTSLSETAASVRQGTSDAVGYVQLISEIIKIIKSVLTGTKK